VVAASGQVVADAVAHLLHRLPVHPLLVLRVEGLHLAVADGGDLPRDLALDEGLHREALGGRLVGQQPLVDQEGEGATARLVEGLPGLGLRLLHLGVDRFEGDLLRADAGGDARRRCGRRAAGGEEEDGCGGEGGGAAARHGRLGG
jgi:hypothetical protein